MAITFRYTYVHDTCSKCHNVIWYANLNVHVHVHSMCTCTYTCIYKTCKCKCKCTWTPACVHAAVDSIHIIKRKDYHHNATEKENCLQKRCLRKKYLILSKQRYNPLSSSPPPPPPHHHHHPPLWSQGDKTLTLILSHSQHLSQTIIKWLIIVISALHMQTLSIV